MPTRTYYIPLSSFNGSELIGDNEYITMQINEPYWWEKLFRKEIETEDCPHCRLRICECGEYGYCEEYDGLQDWR